MSILKEICDEKLLEVNKLKSTITESKLLDLIKLQEKPRGFKKTLDYKVSKSEFGLIAAKYLETLQRSNEQLVKLASLLQKNKKEMMEFLKKIDKSCST